MRSSLDPERDFSQISPKLCLESFWQCQRMSQAPVHLIQTMILFLLQKAWMFIYVHIRWSSELALHSSPVQTAGWNLFERLWCYHWWNILSQIAMLSGYFILSHMWLSLHKSSLRRKIFFYSTRANTSICVACVISSFFCTTYLLYLALPSR